MSKGVITFFFDEGQVFQESWEMLDVHSESLAIRLKRIAIARLPLLASCVRVVQLKADGHPLERVNLKGKGSEFADPRTALSLTEGGRNVNIMLRGVPEDLFADKALTAAGLGFFQKFSSTVSDCSCIIVRRNKAYPITDLEPGRETLLSSEATKKATRIRLNALLGKQETDRFWYSANNKQ